MCVANVNGRCLNFAYGPNTERAFHIMTLGKCELECQGFVRFVHADPYPSLRTSFVINGPHVRV